VFLGNFAVCANFPKRLAEGLCGTRDGLYLLSIALFQANNAAMLNDNSPTDNGLHFVAILHCSDKEMFSGMWLPKAIRSHRAFVQGLRIVLGSILVANIACRSARISGTYVANGNNFVSSLSLTQAEGGQITGVLNVIQLSADGKIGSADTPVTSGTLDGKQLTLTLNPGLLGLHPGSLGKNIAGTIEGDTIRIQTVGSNGGILSEEFQRSSPAEFKTYADQLRLRAGGIILSNDLLERAQEMHRTIQNAEQWISNAELHAQRIPRAKEYYLKIEDKMKLLVARERITPSAVARTQISVMVIQGNVAGSQVDVQEDQTWDVPLEDSGKRLSQTLGIYSERCWEGAGGKFQKNGATPQAVANWESACHEALTEQAKFEPIYKRIMEQRADLKSFQAMARSRRQALVDEASRIQ
jgi:hypothetical protein